MFSLAQGLVPITIEMNLHFQHPVIIVHGGQEVYQKIEQYVNISILPSAQQSDIVRIIGPPSLGQ